jgi:NADH-quinone oxidoreductase subunit L
MTVALGVSAYGAAMFHLMTHAFFKALLFLAAGSVIIGMHHEQDMRKMGGLGKYMPITAVTSWIGALALIGTPFLSGFYSKDTIIEAVAASHRWGASYAYWCVLAGVFVTALYTFRMIFMTFHGPERFRHAPHSNEHEHGAHDCAGHSEPHESPPVVTVPLIALAIPSVVIGFLTAGALLFGGAFGDSILVLERNDVLGELSREYHGPIAYALHGLAAPTFWLAAGGVAAAWLFFLWRPALADRVASRLAGLRMLLVNKYYFDWFNEKVIAAGSRLLGAGLWKGGDQALIDGGMVNGTANTVGRIGGLVRLVQSGFLYTYAFWMIIGLAAILGVFLLKT